MYDNLLALSIGKVSFLKLFAGDFDLVRPFLVAQLPVLLELVATPETLDFFMFDCMGDLELDLSLYLEGSLVLFNGLSHILFSVGLDDLEKLSLANFFFTGSGLLDFKRLSLAFFVLTWSCNFHFFFLCCHFYSSCVVLLWICFLSSSLLVLDYWILIQKNILICLYMKCKMKLLKKMSLMKSFLCDHFYPFFHCATF